MASKKNPSIRATRGIQHKTLDTFVAEIAERRVKQVFAVMGNVDNGGDVIHRRAFEKTLAERFDQIRTLWQHDGDDPPIGVPLELKEIERDALPADVLSKYPDCEGALLGVIEYLDTPRGNEVLQGIKRGAIKKNSIGYSAIKYDYQDTGDAIIRHLREVMLWDVSPVNWGMNEATLNLKQAQPWRDTGIAEMNAPWQTPLLDDFTVQDWDALSEPEIKRIASHFAWALDSQPHSFDELQLAHHQPSRDGKGKAVWTAVQAALHALPTLAMPDEDRRAVYDHLAKHYAQFEQEPLPFEMLEAMRQATMLVTASQGMADQLKVGRMISAANLALMQEAVGKIKAASSTLDDLIARAQPPEPEPQPTQPVIVLDPPPTIVVVAKNATPQGDATQDDTTQVVATQVDVTQNDTTQDAPPSDAPKNDTPTDDLTPDEPGVVEHILDVPTTRVPVNTLTMARYRAIGMRLKQ